MVRPLLLSVLLATCLGNSCDKLEGIKLYKVECEEECNFVRRDKDDIVEIIDVKFAVKNDDYGAMTSDDIALLIDLASQCRELHE